MDKLPVKIMFATDGFTVTGTLHSNRNTLNSKMKFHQLHISLMGNINYFFMTGHSVVGCIGMVLAIGMRGV